MSNNDAVDSNEDIDPRLLAAGRPGRDVSSRYTYTLASPVEMTQNRPGETVYQVTGHRQLIVTDGARGIYARQASIYNTAGTNVLRVLLCYGAVILVGLVAVFVLDLLLELFILFHNSVPPYLNCFSDDDYGSSDVEACDMTGFLCSIPMLFALPVLMSVGTALLTLAIGMLGDVWSSFEWYVRGLCVTVRMYALSAFPPLLVCPLHLSLCDRPGFFKVWKG